MAEGVETAEQAEALSRRGYRLLQGYFFGRPAAEPDFTAINEIVRTTGNRHGVAPGISLV